VTDTTPTPAPPPTSGPPGQPGVQHPVPGQPGPGRPPVHYPPPPPGYYPPRPPGYVPVPLAPDGRPLGSFVDRFVAYLVDSLIMGGVTLLFWIPAFVWWFSRFAAETVTMNSSLEPDEPLPPGFFADLFVGYLVLTLIIMGLTLIISYVYEVEMSWKQGQTIGKRIMKLQIAPVTPGEQRTRKMFVKRWATEFVVGTFVPFFFYVDVLWQLWDKPLQQALHDKAAGTVVVKIGR